ncbi:hypothetical protein WJ542_27150 [Paraburkholderia sp. B3]|uniref:hypothetical protein n=1 Tax=Paraburkholderia sp. B3 TaxID=3134791 RepID=UPI00398290C8
MKAFDLACGPWTLIEDGIGRYIVLNDCKPLALVLHPFQAVALCLQDIIKPGLLDSISIIVSRVYPLPILPGKDGSHFEL